MCRHPAIRAPFKGWSWAYLALVAINPGISFSARSISRRPKAASDFCKKLTKIKLLGIICYAYDICHLKLVRWSSTHVCGWIVKFGIERSIVEKQLSRYSSEGSTEDTLEKKIAEVDLNAYGYSQKFEFRSEWATLSLVETSRTYAGFGIGLFGAASPDCLHTFVTFATQSRINVKIGKAHDMPVLVKTPCSSYIIEPLTDIAHEW